MSRPESPEARAERILAELRDATREAAGVLKDLNATVARARAEVEEYTHNEIQRALNKACDQVVVEARRVCSEHEAAVIQRVIEYAALIEANFSRDALVREAVNHIEQRVAAEVKVSRQYHEVMGGGIVISACDRPHAD